MKTALYNSHLALGAKMVSFSGWEMPLQYESILAEHEAVRHHVGIFDVSHMGRVRVEGPESEPFLDYLSTNQIAGKKNGTATYTVCPNSNGGSVDDLLVYKKDATRFFVIVNAGNRQKDLDHLKQFAPSFNVVIQDCYSQEGILAVQGPQAIEVGKRLFPELANLAPMHFVETKYQEVPLIVSRTGYTGAGGFELYVPIDILVKLWDHFLREGVKPVGLGARDTLRLEMGYALYGHELSDTIAPLESVAAWTVKGKGRDFVGKVAMEALARKRSAYGVEVLEGGIPREGFDVFKDGMRIGQVTSGTFSPTLKRGIALLLVEGKLQIGDVVEVQIRDNRVKAKVVPLPFV